MNHYQYSLPIMLFTYFCIFVLGIVLCTALGAQELSATAIHNNTTEPKNTPKKEIVIVPILHEFPTISVIAAQNIYRAIEADRNMDIHTTLTLGEQVLFAQVPSLLEKYLLEYDYYGVIFVGAVSKQNTTEQDSTLAQNTTELLELAESQITNFDIELQLYQKGSVDPMYEYSYESDLTKIKLSLQSQREAAEVQDVQVLNLYKIVLDTIEQLFISIVYINPEEKNLPEYNLRIGKTLVPLSRTEEGVAYFSSDKQRVKVYQIINGEEILVKRFIKQANIRAQNVKVEFIDLKKTEKFSIDILLGGNIPIYRHSEGIFYPSLILANELTFHMKQAYVGVTVFATVLTLLDTVDPTLTSRYGVLINGGLKVPIGRLIDWHTGLSAGVIMLTLSNLGNYNYASQYYMPALGLDTGLEIRMLRNRFGSMRALVNVGLLSVYARDANSTDIGTYLAGQIHVGIGWKL